MSLVLILRVFLVCRFDRGLNLYKKSSRYFLRNDCDCKVVHPHLFIKKVLDIFEKQSCRKFGSHCFCKIKTPNKNFLKLSFNKKIRTNLSFLPQQKTDTTAQLYCTLSTYITPKTISCQNQKI